MKKKFLILPSIAFFSVLSIFFYLLIIERNPSEIPSNLIDKKVPIFEAESLFKNEKFISSNEFKNEIILVNFFATWCKPCRDEHVYIKRFANKKGLKVIGINYRDNPKKTIKWLKDLGNPYKDILIDQNGNIAAGTSTGGMTNKRWNRIGDSPLIGAGTYANNKTCGVSSTGWGEYFIRGMVAHDISAMMEYKGVSLQEASEEVIQKKIPVQYQNDKRI